MSGRWPARLWIARHGESVGNVAREAAYAAGSHRIALTVRDNDVPLSARGKQQASALGRWFSHHEPDERPDVLLASPYLRARDTARLFREAGGCDRGQIVCVDERLREKEFGILDGLTTAGIAALEPGQAELRRLNGKFYHRPPGGESWCDVILRLRSLMDTVSLHYAGRRVMIVAHQVVVLCLRYIIEELDEERVLAIDRSGTLANCSITEYRFDPAGAPDGVRDGGLSLVRFNAVAPMIEEDAPVTAEPHRQVAST